MQANCSNPSNPLTSTDALQALDNRRSGPTMSSNSSTTLPQLSEGWSWNLTRPPVRCTNSKCCGPDGSGHPKVHIELLLHDQVRRHGTIDVEFYGDGRAVTARAQAMLDSILAEQLRSVGLT
jgi:hypothetical protein